ncbi:MAG: hypothetical protein V4437_01090 [Patescibacteria group bacterium]
MARGEMRSPGVDMGPVKQALLQTGRNAYQTGDITRIESVKKLLKFFGFPVGL